MSVAGVFHFIWLKKDYIVHEYLQQARRRDLGGDAASQALASASVIPAVPTSPPQQVSTPPEAPLCMRGRTLCFASRMDP